MVLKQRAGGFTLVEVLVIAGIVVVLAGLVAGILTRVKDSSKSVVCLNNLKQIAAAIQMYHADHKAMPNKIYPLLQNTGYLTDNATFKCPADRTANVDSYGPFYLPRSLGDAQKLFLGCPRHAGKKTIALFGWPQFNISRTCTVLWNGSPVTQGTVVQGGELTFEDGTKVVINDTLPVGVMLSTVDQNKNIYSAISIQDGDLGNGSLTVTHPTGVPSQFEVLTPSLITGVAGTVFQVKTQWPDSSDSNSCSTEITCTEGKVFVENRATEKITPVEVKNGVAGTLKLKSLLRTASVTSVSEENTKPNKPWWWWWWKLWHHS